MLQQDKTVTLLWLCSLLWGFITEVHFAVIYAADTTAKPISQCEVLAKAHMPISRWVPMGRLRVRRGARSMAKIKSRVGEAALRDLLCSLSRHCGLWKLNC